MLDAGKLDRRILLQTGIATIDDFGGQSMTWMNTATVWAEVIPISDGERWRAQEVAAHATHRFRIRWGMDVTVTDRLIYEGRTYEISGVKEIGRREGQELTAAARVD